MDRIGTILDIEAKEVVVMTKESKFYIIKRCPDMYIGKKVSFHDSDILQRKRNIRSFSAIGAGVAAVMVFACIYLYFLYMSDDVYAYVCLDVNPSVEFAIDNEQMVMDVQPFNTEAKVVMNDIQVEGIPVDEAVALVFQKSRELGFIQQDQEVVVLLSTLLCREKEDDIQEKILLERLKMIEPVLNKESNAQVVQHVVKVSSTVREIALQNNISMGRGFIYESMQKKGINISVEDARGLSIGEAWKLAQLNGNDNLLVDGNKGTGTNGKSGGKGSPTPTVVQSQNNHQPTPMLSPTVARVTLRPTKTFKRIPTATPTLLVEPTPFKASTPPSIPTPPKEPTMTATPSPTPVKTHLITPSPQAGEGTKAEGIPGKMEFTVNNWNGDSYYSVTMNMWWGNNGTVFKLYENDELVHTETLIDNTPYRQTVSVYFQNKPKGTYKYRGELTNQFGKSTATMEITVTK